MGSGFDWFEVGGEGVVIAFGAGDGHEGAEFLAFHHGSDLADESVFAADDGDLGADGDWFGWCGGGGSEAVVELEVDGECLELGGGEVGCGVREDVGRVGFEGGEFAASSFDLLHVGRRVGVALCCGASFSLFGSFCGFGGPVCFALGAAFCLDAFEFCGGFCLAAGHVFFLFCRDDLGGGGEAASLGCGDDGGGSLVGFAFGCLAGADGGECAFDG